MTGARPARVPPLEGRSAPRPVVPFNKAGIAGDELDYARQAILSGHQAGDGAFTTRCQRLLEGLLSAPKVLLTTSCTAALEMAALLLDVQPGDEVIVPSFTFVSTANAFALRGASIRFADVRPDTLNLDERCLERMVTPRTKAIVPVHYAGVACEMDAIVEIAARCRAAVVEDNAHGLMGQYRGRPLGSWGALATLSFHETKNFSCGEGGALVINDSRFVERAEILREKGTDRSRFFRGQVSKYTWVDVGSSFLPSDILAAVLCAQLEARDRIQLRRRCLWERYRSGLTAWAERNGVALPVVPAHCAPAFHLFHMLMPTTAQRQALIARLKARGISAVFHYQPLHLSPMGQRFGGRAGLCPVSEDASARLIRLPLFAGLTDQQQATVLEAVEEFECGQR